MPTSCVNQRGNNRVEGRIEFLDPRDSSIDKVPRRGFLSAYQFSLRNSVKTGQFVSHKFPSFMLFSSYQKLCDNSLALCRRAFAGLSFPASSGSEGHPLTLVQ